MAWQSEYYKITIKLTAEMLGTVPKSRSIWTNWVVGKSRKKMLKEGKTEQEIDAKVAEELPDIAEADDSEVGHTTFFQDEKGYYLQAYQVRGFLKETARILGEYDGIKQLNSKVTKYLHVLPAKIRIAPPGELEVCERPLRGQTPQGPRVCIARSDCVPAGTEIVFYVESLEGVLTVELLFTLLDYGRRQGLMQWRSGGRGSFDIVSIEECDAPFPPQTLKSVLIKKK